MNERVEYLDIPHKKFPSRIAVQASSREQANQYPGPRSGPLKLYRSEPQAQRSKAISSIYIRVNMRLRAPRSKLTTSTPWVQKCFGM